MMDPSGEQFGSRLFSFLSAIILWVLCALYFHSVEQPIDMLKISPLINLPATAFPAVVVGLFLYWASFAEARYLRWLGFLPAIYTSLLGSVALVVWVIHALRNSA
jgi:ABC-type tungstate transport system substrate-binding protein